MYVCVRVSVCMYWKCRRVCCANGRKPGLTRCIYICMYIYIYIYTCMCVHIYVCVYVYSSDTPTITQTCLLCPWQETEVFLKCEVDALGVITFLCGCFERCCSNQKTPAYHSNLNFIALRNRRPTLLRAPAYRTPSEASPRRRCSHASQYLSVAPIAGHRSLPQAAGRGAAASRTRRTKEARRQRRESSQGNVGQARGARAGIYL